MVMPRRQVCLTKWYQDKNHFYSSTCGSRQYLWKSATTAAGSGREELRKGGVEAVAAAARGRRERTMPLDAGAPAMVSSRITRRTGVKMQWIL
jgi:hypothetical protein